MTPTWDQLVKQMQDLARRFDDSISSVQLRADETMLRVADAYRLNDERHAEKRRGA